MQQHSQETLHTQFAHRSIRKFTEQAIAPELLETLIAAGQAASTSSFLQSVSVVRVSDPQLRAAIRSICVGNGKGGHPYVEHCAEFLVFCADTTRAHALLPEVQTDWTEVLLVGAVDVGIFAQNVLLAAESVGLGGVFIGSIRNDLDHIIQLLQLPQGVLPIVGMCLGYPAQDPMMRPRLPQSLIVSHNQYQSTDVAKLSAYNDIVRQYYQERSSIDSDWVAQFRANWGQAVRPNVLSIIQAQGFAKR